MNQIRLIEEYNDNGGDFLKTVSVATPVEREIRKKEIETENLNEVQSEKIRKKSPYKKWTQVNNDSAAKEARYWLMKENPVAYCIMDFLASNMDMYNAVICSYKVIQEKFGYSKATVTRAIKLLKDHKFLQVAKSGTSNIYMINKTLYWNSWGNNYAYAEFGAKVIISSSEQEKTLQNEIKIKKHNEIKIKNSGK